MVRKALPRQIADIKEILTSICDKWALLVLYELSRGTKRYGELRRSIRGVSQKMLTQTLRKLERDGMVRRTVYPIAPPRVEYARVPESMRSVLIRASATARTFRGCAK